MIQKYHRLIDPSNLVIHGLLNKNIPWQQYLRRTIRGTSYPAFINLYSKVLQYEDWRKKSYKVGLDMCLPMP